KRWPRWGRLTNMPSYPTDRLLPNGSSSAVPAFRSEWAPDFTAVAAASGSAKLLERRRRESISDSRSALMANQPGGSEFIIKQAAPSMKSQRALLALLTRHTFEIWLPVS